MQKKVGHQIHDADFLYIKKNILTVLQYQAILLRIQV